MKEAGVHFIHWISPIWHIEFMRRRLACKFEEPRKKYDNYEALAWNELRRIVGRIFVVSHSKYVTAEQGSKM